MGPVTEQQLDLLSAARDDCERLQRIVDDLLDLARIRAGLLELSPGPLDVSTLLEQALGGVRSAAEQAGVKLAAQVDPGSETLVADKERLALALQNLLSNAIRHTANGGTVTLRAAEDEDGMRFSVKDTGQGIAPEYLPRLFDRFFRVPGADWGKRRARAVHRQGRGRGPRRSGGRGKRPGQGSTFWLTIPSAGPAASRPPAKLG